LIKSLLANYSHRGLPVFNLTEPLVVRFGIRVVNVQTIDQVGGKVVALVWTRCKWRDDQLKWNPEHYGGLKVVSMASSTQAGTTDGIWQPDLTLLNAADAPKLMPTKAWVMYDGSVGKTTPMQIAVDFHPHLQHFPFDTQVIRWKWISWSYDKTQLRVIKYTGLTPHPEFELEVDDKPFDAHILMPEWTIGSRKMTVSDKYYTGYPDPYQTSTFTLEIKRNSRYYMDQLVWPAVILAMVAYLSFWMNRNVLPARTTVCMTSTLAQVTLRIVVSSKLPVTMTWLDQFLGRMLWVHCFALLEFVMVQYITRSSGGLFAMYLLSSGKKDKGVVVAVGDAPAAEFEQGINVGVLQIPTAAEEPLEEEEETPGPTLAEEERALRLWFCHCADVFSRCFVAAFFLIFVLVSISNEVSYGKVARGY